MHTLTVESIRRLADGGSFVRGRGYLVEGRVRDAVLLDDRLTGTCIGSMPIDYEMEITLEPGRIESARCTCPRGGFCKHLVALALLFVERPDEVAHLDRDRLVEILANVAPSNLPTC